MTNTIQETSREQNVKESKEADTLQCEDHSVKALEGAVDENPL
jgi:hypothetical protein